jgi:NADH dehydrogenase/NADH:ubiquinone oxidoreductase 75 kD subunit (chain G)
MKLGSKHTSIFKIVKKLSWRKKKYQTLCDDPNLAPYGACRVCSVEVAWKKMAQQKL